MFCDSCSARADRRDRLDDQEDRDPSQQAEDRHAGSDGGVGEDSIAGTALAAACGGEDLACVGCGVDVRAQGLCLCSISVSGRWVQV